MTVLAMSDGELSRFDTLQRVQRGELRAADAARLLGLRRRQVYRLLDRLCAEGAAGLVSRKRGRPSNRRYDDTFREHVVAIVREHYHDFGPTLAREYLAERHDIHLACETLRQFMIAAGLWKDREARRPRPYQPRYRRDCRGELVQVDGSKHWWFEDRGPQCTLLVYISTICSTKSPMILQGIAMTITQAEPNSGDTKRRRVRLNPTVRREQIVAQATRLIAQSGFNAVSLADVANACEVRKSTILHYFPSMKALLIEVLVGRDARDIGATPLTDLVSIDAHCARELITTKIEDNLHQREIIRLFHVLAAEALAPEHPTHEYFRQRSQRARAALCTILSWKRDPPTAALELLAFWEGLELEWLTDPDTDIIPAWHGFADRFFKND